MDMYDGQGNPVTDYDPAKGRLEMQKRMHHHEAVEAVEEQGHWETVVEYPETGGRDVQWVVDVPGVEAQEAWDEEETYWLYIPLHGGGAGADGSGQEPAYAGGAGEGAGGSAGAAVVRRNGGDGG